MPKTTRATAKVPFDTTTEEEVLISVVSMLSVHHTKTTTNNNGKFVLICLRISFLVDILTHFLSNLSIFLIRCGGRYRLFWWLNGPNSNKNNNKGVFSSLFSSGPGPNYRGRLVNPWIPAWTYLDQGSSGKRVSSSASSDIGRGDWWPKDRQKGPPWWSQERYLSQAM